MSQRRIQPADPSARPARASAQPADESAQRRATRALMRDFERSLPMQLLKAREAAMARFRPMLRDHGLTEQQWRVLRVLAAYEPLDAGEVSRRSLLQPPSLSRILQFLQGGQLVRRSVDPSDHRRALFALTARGRALFARIAPNSEALYAAIEQAFGREKLAQLYALLGEFHDALGARSGPGDD